MQAAIGPAHRNPDFHEGHERLLLVLGCHDALLRNLGEARRLHLVCGVGAACEENRKARDLVRELARGLDFERGGGIASDLGRIYDFAIHELIDLDHNPDGSMYDHLIRLFEELRGAWEHVRVQN